MTTLKLEADANETEAATFQIDAATGQTAQLSFSRAGVNKYQIGVTSGDVLEVYDDTYGNLLQFSGGDMRTQPQGAGTNAFGQNGAAFKQLLSGTASISSVSVPAGGSTTFTVTVTNAVAGDVVAGIGYSAALPDGLVLQALGIATGVVTVSVRNVTSAALTLPTGTARVDVRQY